MGVLDTFGLDSKVALVTGGSRGLGLQIAEALHMIQRGQGGRIINIASVAGLRGTDPSVLPALPYNTSKGAVVNFTRALAATLAEHNITVNCICPGFFPTRMSAVTLKRAGD